MRPLENCAPPNCAPQNCAPNCADLQHRAPVFIAMREASSSGFRNPNNLPTKICVHCQRPFTWRKKWERNWDEVTTCSKSCNSKRRAMAKQQCGSGDSDGADSVTTLGSTSSQGSHALDKKALRMRGGPGRRSSLICSLLFWRLNLASLLAVRRCLPCEVP